MARKHGSSSVNAFALKRQIITLKAEGLSLRAIASAVGCSHIYVKTVLDSGFNVEAVTIEDTLKWCLDYKEKNKSEGADYVLYYCKEQYLEKYGDIKNISFPSSATLERHFKAQNMTRQQISGRSDKRRVWQRERPEKHGDMYQCDLKGPFFIGGEQYYIFACIDTESRIVWGELVAKNYFRYLAWGLERCYQVLGGAPTEQKCDNGIGFIRPSKKTIGAFAQMAFNLGTQSILYVPEAQPERNGKIERWNRTFKEQFLWKHNLETMSIAEARNALYEWLITYNTKRPHSELKMTPPAKNGTFIAPLPETPKVLKVEAERSGKVTYWRPIDSRGVCTVRTPAEYYAISGNLAGNYAEIQIDWATKTGSVTVEKQIIGTFTHTGTMWNEVQLTDNAKNVKQGQLWNEQAYLNTLRKRMKNNKVTTYPEGVQLIQHNENMWNLIDEETGEIYLDQDSILADHLEDVGIFLEA